jgi:DNA-binding transcriptional ArsR family regulator
MENYRRLEGVVRGFSNHQRIQIMDFLDKNPEYSVDEISEALKVNFKTISGHLKRLAISGLVKKRSDSVNIRHKLSERGSEVLTFLRRLK